MGREAGRIQPYWGSMLGEGRAVPREARQGKLSKGLKTHKELQTPSLTFNIEKSYVGLLVRGRKVRV